MSNARDEHEALSQHVEAMTRLLLDSGDITQHAAIMYRRVIEQHQLEPVNETSRDNVSLNRNAERNDED